MNLLNPPLDWTKPELNQLRDLFVLAYRRPSEAEILAEKAGIVPGTFPLFSDMRITSTQLFRVMANQGKLHRMIELAMEDATAASYRDRFEETLNGNPELPVPDAPKGRDWWKGDDSHPATAVKLYHERLMERRSRLFNIEIARQVGEVARSIAKLQLHFERQRANGTGFLIQPDLILTNEHNVNHPDYGRLTGMDVIFDYEETAGDNGLVRQALLDSIEENKENDWAVVRLNVPVDRPVIPLGTKFTVGLNDHLIIIQHPLGGFKQFALEPLAIRYIDEGKTRIQYVADTQKGSSGSPVFNTYMHVVALHHAEAEVSCRIDGEEKVMWRNEGIHIDRIIQDLKSRNIPFTSIDAHDE